MIVHNVMWKFADGVDRDSAFTELKPLLEGLVEKIPTLRSLELGLGINEGSAAWDLVLRSCHDSRDDLEAYRNHPEHLRAASRLREFVSEAAVVDYSS